MWHLSCRWNNYGGFLRPTEFFDGIEHGIGNKFVPFRSIRDKLFVSIHDDRSLKKNRWSVEAF